MNCTNLIGIAESQRRADEKFLRNGKTENMMVKRFFTDEQVNELERCIVTAMNLRSESDRRKLLRRAKEIISQALGE